MTRTVAPKGVFLVALLSLGLIVAGVDLVSQPTARAADLAYTKLVEDTTVTANPERGWHVQVLTNSKDLYGYQLAQAKGYMVMLKADLGAYKTGDLPQTKLDEIAGAFAKARTYGRSVIFRAAYAWKSGSGPEPASLNLIARHIEQLQPIFVANEDILFTVQAGFLGPWGEWHASRFPDKANKDVPSAEAQATVINALLKAVPASVAIEVRRPVFARGLLGSAQVTQADAFTGSRVARIGLHNDAVLTTDSDAGTYSDTSFTRDQELAWQNVTNAYVPFTGESNKLTDRSLPQAAVKELNQLHAQSLNYGYYESVMARWKATTFQGQNTYNYIEQHLGYRFVASGVGISGTVKAGGALQVHVDLQNQGFGNLMKAHNVQLVMSQGSQRHVVPLAADPRTWRKTSGPIGLDWYVSLPSGLAPGNWDVALALPSAFSGLAQNPAYSIRLANQGTWDQATGTNRLGSFTVAGQGGITVEAFEQVSAVRAAELNAALPPSTTPPPPPSPSVTPSSSPTPSVTPPTPPPATTSPPTPSATPSATPTPTVTSTTPPPPPTETPVWPTVNGLDMAVTNTADTLTVKVTGTGLNVKSQLFIAAPAPNTIYLDRWTTPGINYLVENTTLHAYAGQGGKWGWNQLAAKPTATKAATAVTITGRRADIGLTPGDAVGLGFISNDSKAKAYPATGTALASYVIGQ